MTIEPCPEVDVLAAFACGELGSGRARIVSHLDRCVDCRRVVAAAAHDDEDANDSTDESIRTGPRIGRFVVQQILGEGAMGVVHLAYDPDLRRSVAVKVIKEDSGDQLAHERLLLEAQTAAQLSHPNTVTIYDVGVHEGQPYVAMEFVEGTTLASWLKQNASWREALAIVLAAGEGLAAAHAAGLVHRDFKPGNVLVGANGAVKVSDFGLARFANERASLLAAREDALELPRSSRAVTSTGVLVGTPAYTSPEQFSGASATALSDQFAFGVAVYRALYGVRPFHGPTLYAVYEAICNDATPPPPKDSRVPLALWPVIARALAKEPAQRYPDMQTLLASLREAAGLGSTGALLGEECPFPGLVSFAETDARVYFGRAAEVNEVLGRLREHACAAVVGPSGAGKSSFVRALVIPRFRRDEASGDVLSLHPGAQPFAALARLVAPLVESGHRGLDELQTWLREDPSRFGEVLARHARARDGAVLVYVDQLEELYVQCADRAERIAFGRALSLIGRDPARPLRLVFTLRSDFLDRAAECSELMGRITAGFVFLGAPTHATLAQALIGPIATTGYDLEDPAIASEIARELEDQPGAFPLLQFVGGRLWEARDRVRRSITRESLAAIGAVSGALAVHADQVLAQLPTDDSIARAILLRLVTPERTRVAVAVRELAALGPHGHAQKVIDVLVRGRLLVADQDTVELVHETLISAWPTLRRWLDDEAGDARILADLAASARRWDASSRPEGMLWSGEPARHAITLEQRGARLTELEAAFVAASRAVMQRSGRRRRALVAVAVVVLAAIAIIATASYFRVRASERAANESAERARAETVKAQAAEAAAQTAKEAAEDALRKVTKAEELTREARAQTTAANVKVQMGDAELARKNVELQRALDEAKAARRVAEESAAKQRAAVAELTTTSEKLESALQAARAANAKLERKLKEADSYLGPRQ